MRIRRRILANAAVAAIAAGGLVAVTEAPAVAATYWCTYKAVTYTSDYVQARNYGYGGYGQCYQVRARAQDDTGGALYFRYGNASSSISTVSSIGYPLVYRQTNGSPGGYPGCCVFWASWSGWNGVRNVSVTT